MTTANLSVGIDTKQAFASLKALRAEMQSQPHNLLVNLDSNSLDRQIQTFIRRKPFVISINTKALSAEISNDVGVALDNAFAKKGRTLSWNAAGFRGSMNSAVDPIFSDKTRRLEYNRTGLMTNIMADVGGTLAQEHKVNIDRTNLVLQIKTAVTEGLAGARLVVGAAGGATAPAQAATLPPAALASMVRELRAMLVPVVDEMGKAAAQMTSLARKTGIARDAGSASASQAQSFKSVDGVTTKYNLPVKQDEVPLALQAIRVGNQGKAEDARKNFENNLDLRDTQAAIKRAAAEKAALQAQALSVGPDYPELLKLRDVASAKVRKESEAESKALQAQALSVGPDQTQLLKLRDVAAAKVRKESEAESKALQAQALSVGPDFTQLLKLRDVAAAKSRKDIEAEQKALQAQALSYGPDRSTLLKLRDAATSQSRTTQAQSASNDAVKNLAFNAPQLEPLQRYEAQLKKVKQAQSLIADGRTDLALQRFGSVAVSQVSNLRNLQSTISALKPASDGVVESHRKLNSIMNDGHSAARGLAGSMGALWTTYGSIVPLVAAAALGASLRSIFTIGKDVEYQLKFVQVLSSGTAISAKEFGDSVRGSLTTPVEASQALRALAQNGLSARESLAALPAVLQLATAGEMTLTEAALSATGVMAAFNLQVTDLGRIGDVFAKAAAVSNTSVTEMAEAMKQASTVSDLYHVSLEDTAATLAIMAQRNIRGTAAGTAFRNMMVELATPHKAATAAMKQMGLQLYDNNNVLKDYGSVLGQLREKTMLLNEKGRLTFLNEIFGERGSKAVNAILSDFEKFGDMQDQIKNKSKDFAASVTEALGETTQGKIKALMTEFQLSTSSAFDATNTSAKHFIDTLRFGVSSDEFRTYLVKITEGLASLATFLVDHAKLIGMTVAAWAALKVADGVVSGFIAMRAAMTAAGIAATGLAVASRAALAGMTGGLSIVVALAAEYLLFRGNTDYATTAQKAFDDQMRITSQGLDRSIELLGKENVLLARKVELLRQGYSVPAAQKMVEDEQSRSKGKTFDVTANEARGRVESLEQQLEAAKLSRKNVVAAGGSPTSDNIEITRIERDMKAAQESVRSAEDNALKFQTEANAKSFRAQGEDDAKRLGQAKTFNDELYALRNKNKKLDLTGLFITQGEAKSGSTEQFDDLVKERKDALNKKLGDYKKPDPAAARVAHSEDMARSKQLIASLNNEEKEVQQYIKFRKQLDDAKYSPSLFGAQTSAALAEQRQIQETIDLLKLEESQIAKLRGRKDDKSNHLTGPDRTNLQTEINNRNARYDADLRDLIQQKELSKLKSETRKREDQADFNKESSKLGLDSDADIRKIRESYSTKIESPGDAKGTEAARAVNEKYASAIVNHQEKLNTLQESEALLLAEKSVVLNNLDEFDSRRLASLSIGIEATQEAVALEQTKLSILIAQGRIASTKARTVGKDEFEKSQTAEYGFSKFWEKYQSDAQSAASMVESVMQKSTDAMSTAVGNFATTGKFHFRSFASSVAADAAKMLANKAIASLIGMAVNYVAGAYGGGAVGANVAKGSADGWSPTFNEAHGGVMTEYGRLPLRTFAKGGIAHGPVASIHGEGSLPEANVPLQDGRSIPVTLSGGQGGGNTSVSIQVNIDSGGKSAVESDASGQKAAQLGKMVEASVVNIIQREKRSGGLLYA